MKIEVLCLGMNCTFLFFKFYQSIHYEIENIDFKI
jgi:hypothetical protein